MSIETARTFLLYCSIINYGILILWAVVGIFGRELMYRVWVGWFRLPRELCDAINFGGMTLYKLGIFLFNIVPCIALYLVK